MRVMEDFQRDLGGRRGGGARGDAAAPRQQPGALSAAGRRGGRQTLDRDNPRRDFAQQVNCHRRHSPN